MDCNHKIKPLGAIFDQDGLLFDTEVVFERCWEEEGEKIGIEKGRAEGIEKGRAEGIEKGRAEEKIAMTKSLLGMHLPIDQIAQVTGLSIAEIQALKEDICAE